MKQEININDIREGDLIRWEREAGPGRAKAIEYTAREDRYLWGRSDGTHYLLDRPEPPFEPYWGMVIGEPKNHKDDGGVKAVYVPTGDGQNWFSHVDPNGSPGIYYFEDDWAKEKLASGWVVFEAP